MDRNPRNTWATGIPSCFRVPDQGNICWGDLRVSLLLLFIALEAFRHIPPYEVVADPCGRGLDAVEPRVDDGQGHGDVEEGVGLVLGEDLLEPQVGPFAFFRIEGGAPLLEEPVHLPVPIADEVQAVSLDLGGMPDIEEVRILPGGPAQDDGLEASLVDELANERGSLDGAYLDLDTDHPEAPLDDLRRFHSAVVPLIRDNREGEGTPILVEEPVLGI